MTIAVPTEREWRGAKERNANPKKRTNDSKRAKKSDGMQKKWRQTATRTSDGGGGVSVIVSVGRVESRSLRVEIREEEVESNVGLGAALGHLQSSQGPGRALY